MTLLRTKVAPGRLSAGIAPAALLIFLLGIFNFAAPAQQSGSRPQPPPDTDKSPGEQSDQSKQAPQEPVERADTLKSKVTFGIYFTPGARVYDVNLRHQFGPVTAWVAGFYDPKASRLARVGAQYDYRKGWLHVVPTVELATTRAVAGSLYSELGRKTYAIAGLSRTNLRPFYDLFWDPSESVQLGIGRKINGYDRIQAFTIFDVRLHTHQQNTHVVWRHRLNANNGITFDTLFKSGRTDEGRYIRRVGIGVYYDRPTWFWKLYYDPHVNFTNRTMVRSGIGLKF